MNARRAAFVVAAAVLLSVTYLPVIAQSKTATPPTLVEAYDSLADTILGAKHTESNLVRAILATTYGHAEAAMARAKAKLQAGENAREEIESLAAFVAQLANEGDASIAAIRKRLVEGGHHHNAAGEQQGIYEEGFVVVTRAAKKQFLDAGRSIGKLAASPDLGGLETHWGTVRKIYDSLSK
jgi:uncharacterized protein involved in type VI secretion and phage assembly